MSAFSKALACENRLLVAIDMEELFALSIAELVTGDFVWKKCSENAVMLAPPSDVGKLAGLEANMICLMCGVQHV